MSPRRTEAVMGTAVTMEIVRPHRDAEDAMDRAFDWMAEVDKRCSRFDPASELRQLTASAGKAMVVSPLLFEVVQFAVLVAEESHGAFDPAIGMTMESLGFNREYRTGDKVETGSAVSDDVSYRHVQLDPETSSITLLRPLLLDLGAVAKGFAVDLAVRELKEFQDFKVDAGGDLYLGGRNARGEKWSVGIRHPIEAGALIGSVRVSNQAVCTSGTYERGSHLLDPRSGNAAQKSCSATVIAANAMLADALATSAFVLGPDEGIGFLEAMDVEGLIVAPDLRRFPTRGLRLAT